MTDRSRGAAPTPPPAVPAPSLSDVVNDATATAPELLQRAAEDYAGNKVQQPRTDADL